MTYQASKQASKKTDFTVDLLWWGSLRLAPINIIESKITSQKTNLHTEVMYSGFFRSGRFYEFHESIVIHKNFTLKILTKSIISLSAVDDLSKFPP